MKIVKNGNNGCLKCAWIIFVTSSALGGEATAARADADIPTSGGPPFTYDLSNLSVVNGHAINPYDSKPPAAGRFRVGQTPFVPDSDFNPMVTDEINRFYLLPAERRIEIIKSDPHANWVDAAVTVLDWMLHQSLPPYLDTLRRIEETDFDLKK